jgi:hypothetical protein
MKLSFGFEKNVSFSIFWVPLNSVSGLNKNSL